MPSPPRVIQLVSSVAASGAERTVLDLARTLGTPVVHPGGGWLVQALEAHGVPQVAASMRGFGFFRTAMMLRNRRDADAVHAHLTRALRIALLAEKLGGPVALGTVHIANTAPVYRSLTRLVAVSEFVRTGLVAQGVSPERITVIPNGTDLTDRPPTDRLATRATLGIPPDACVFGVLGRIHRWKGQVDLIRALEGTNAWALLVGRGDEASLLAARAVAGPRVVFAGEVADVTPLLDAMDVLAMPSETETFGIAAIEGMARGLPVLAYRVGALTEVVAHGVTGSVVDKSIDALREGVRAMTPVPPGMGEAGRKRVLERYTVARMADAHRTLYEELGKG